MEVISAERIWFHSMQFGFQYTTMISNGDSKSFTHLRSLNVYDEKEIEKVECFNHVAKRLGTPLRKVVIENTKTDILYVGKSMAA